MPEQTIDELLTVLRNRLNGLAAQDKELLRADLAKVMAVVTDQLRTQLLTHPSRQELPDEDFRTGLMDHLAWIESIRTTVIGPLDEAAIEGRATAIRAGMAAGLPGSAFVQSTGLTLARIYQIRDGRR